MPLTRTNGLEAVRDRKANKFANWGNRHEENRIEPITKPAFDVPFMLNPGESIFTIGSCFARHVETALLDRGFEIPMRDVLSTAAFGGQKPGVLNNFGAPSIYNELAWAFGEEQYRESDAIIEVGVDKFVDLHLHERVRPAPLEIVRARRHAVLEATRSLANCRLLIMTLGLAELWWDEQASTYINAVPLPSVLKRFPDRFSLDVLTFDECHRYVQQAIDCALRYGRQDLQIILTVSPVPMSATHRRMDVINANSYSKALLRTVVEHVVECRDRVTYFPSYEMVTLSDRNIAWADDMEHVTDQMIALNVERMCNAFTCETWEKSKSLTVTSIANKESAEALFFADRARQARISNDAHFFAENRKAAEHSPAFALEWAKLLFDRQHLDEALEYVGQDNRIEAMLLKARILMAKRLYDDVFRVARAISERGHKGNSHWRLWLDAAIAKGSIEDILAIEGIWLGKWPRNRIQILSNVGIAFNKTKAFELARARLAQLIDEEGFESNLILIEYARSLISLGSHPQAAAALKDIESENSRQTALIGRLKREIAEQANRQ